MGRATKRKANDDSSARDLSIYIKVVKNCRSQREVGQEFGVSQQRVAQIIAAVNVELRLEFIKEIRSLKMLHQQQMETLLSETMDGWHRSYGEHVTVTEGRCDAKDCENVFTTTKREDLAGDVRFLTLANQILESMRRMWDPEMKSGASGKGRRFAGKSRDQLRKELRDRLKLLDKRLSKPSMN